MKCQKCGSENVTVQAQTYTKTKRRSFLWNLLMLVCTGGLWFIWMLIRRRKEKVIQTKLAVCNNCGNSWKV